VFTARYGLNIFTLFQFSMLKLWKYINNYCDIGCTILAHIPLVKDYVSVKQN